MNWEDRTTLAGFIMNKTEMVALARNDQTKEEKRQRICRQAQTDMDANFGTACVERVTHIVEVPAQNRRLAGTSRSQHDRLEPDRCAAAIPCAIRGRCCGSVHHWHILWTVVCSVRLRLFFGQKKFGHKT